MPVARAEPDDGFPWPWSVVPWLHGEDATTAPLDRTQAAVDLARFVAALEAIDATDGPRPSRANFGRGVPLAERDTQTRAAIAAARRLVDTDAVAAAWELLDAASREILRAELAVDDATWARSRGWALSTAIVAMPYDERTNPFMADQARRKLAVVLSE